MIALGGRRQCELSSDRVAGSGWPELAAIGNVPEIALVELPILEHLSDIAPYLIADELLEIERPHTIAAMTEDGAHRVL
jgi:hypothetical protein